MPRTSKEDTSTDKINQTPSDLNTHNYQINHINKVAEEGNKTSRDFRNIPSGFDHLFESHTEILNLRALNSDFSNIETPQQKSPSEKHMSVSKFQNKNEIRTVISTLKKESQSKASCVQPNPKLSPDKVVQLKQKSYHPSNSQNTNFRFL